MAPRPAWVSIPPFPEAITSISDPSLRERGKEAWTAAHCLLAAIERWVQLLDLPMLIDDRIEAARIGRTAIKTLALLQVQSAPFQAGDDADSAIEYHWPSLDDHPVSREFYCNPGNDKAKEKINDEHFYMIYLIQPALRTFVDLLRTAPYAALTATTTTVPQSPLNTVNSPVVGFLGAPQLAVAVDIPSKRREAFIKAVARKRPKLSQTDYQEVSNPPQNTPRFLYRADAPEILALVNKFKSPKTA